MTAHAGNGFGWSNPNGGWEYPVMWAAVQAALALLGDGAHAGPVAPGLTATPAPAPAGAPPPKETPDAGERKMDLAPGIRCRRPTRRAASCARSRAATGSPRTAPPARPAPAASAEAGRGRLYVTLICPWAGRTLIARSLKGLKAAIPVTVLSLGVDRRGLGLRPGCRGRPAVRRDPPAPDLTPGPIPPSPVAPPSPCCGTWPAT